MKKLVVGCWLLVVSVAMAMFLAWADGSPREAGTELVIPVPANAEQGFMVLESGEATK